MRELWVKEFCNVDGGGRGCLTGESHRAGTHARRLRDEDVRDALREIAEASRAEELEGIDLLHAFLEELR